MVKKKNEGMVLLVLVGAAAIAVGIALAKKKVGPANIQAIRLI